MQRRELERELEALHAESERGKQVLESLDEKIHALRAEVERQRRLKPAQCSSCRTVTLQVDAAAQSLLGSAGHVARTLLRDPTADRYELLDTVLRYVSPVKHLDPELEELYARASRSLRTATASGSASLRPFSPSDERGPQPPMPDQDWPDTELHGASSSANSPMGTSERTADAEAQALCQGLRAEALSLARAQDWTGTFTEFEARSYRIRVAPSGRRTYFVKVQISLSEVIHLRISRGSERASPILEAVRLGCVPHAPLDFF